MVRPFLKNHTIALSMRKVLTYCSTRIILSIGTHGVKRHSKFSQDQNKPIFLSIGYSTCHWCHVLEKESFEDEEVAALLNENFICIKVDREEHPDVDQFYINVVQAMTGNRRLALNCNNDPGKNSCLRRYLLSQSPTD